MYILPVDSNIAFLVKREKSHINITGIFGLEVNYRLPTASYLGLVWWAKSSNDYGNGQTEQYQYWVYSDQPLMVLPALEPLLNFIVSKSAGLLRYLVKDNTHAMTGGREQ